MGVRRLPLRHGALRFFNVFGTGQALSNSCAAVLAIFASRYLNGRPRSPSMTAGCGRRSRANTGPATSGTALPTFPRPGVSWDMRCNTLEDGLREIAGWLEGQVAQDRIAEAGADLAKRGVTV